MGKDKKKSKSKSRRKHKSKHKSSSDDSDSSEEEWVDMATLSKTAEATQSERSKEVKTHPEVDDWLSNEALFPCVSRKDLLQKKEKEKDNSEDSRFMLDKLGQTDKELNPYWKDGGAGLPPEKMLKTESLRQASATVGDQGVNWLRKALQRAKEQAAEQGRPLENVVAERWGSLETLENMIAEAEQREKNYNRPNYNRREKEGYDNRYRERLDSIKADKKDDKGSSYDKKYKNRLDKSKNGSDYCIKETKSKHKRFAKPNDRSSEDSSSEDGNLSRRTKKRIEASDHSSDEKKLKNRLDKHKNDRDYYSKETDTKHKRFAKPNDGSSENSSAEDDCLVKNSKRQFKKYSYRDRGSSDKYSSRRNSSKERFVKPSGSSSEDDKPRRNDNESRYHKSVDRFHGRQNNYEINYINKKGDRISSNQDFAGIRTEKSYSLSTGWRKKNNDHDVRGKKTEQHKDSDSTVENKCTTSQLIEDQSILTDKEMNELGAKIVKAEILGNTELANELKAKLDRARLAKENKPKEADSAEKVILLTHIDSKGFERPVSLAETSKLSGSRRKSRKVETHSDGKRMRYFADDDKYSLQDMFQREKLSTVEDSNEVFAKLASKGIGKDESARDMEDVFEETACVEECEDKKHARDRQHAIQHSKRVARSLENCQWCLESKQMLKHLIIAIGKTCYLCVPAHQSLTENHCLIVPNCHITCATQLDEDVWAEMQDFRKSLVQMFLSQDEDVVFFESARYLNKFPHMVLNCVPVPKEDGDLAPIYFKKAIQECEMEWSNNKKLVELKGRDVRKAVPKGLPYFAVDFGLESGFAHVIEDEKLFPHNFAQEIIGGMLDLDHTIWRKERKQTFEEQSKKVIKLNKLWSPYNCTKMSNV